jgi:PTS system nitrogen regulatory IIA component
MKITDFLKQSSIIPELRARDKNAALAELSAKIAESIPGLAAKDLERVLWERERLESTGIADGVAIPHGKMASLNELLAAFGRSQSGVEFQAIDGKPSQIFFVLVAPENSVGLHLKALARISRLCKDPGFRGRLLGAQDTADIFRVIREEDDKY